MKICLLSKKQNFLSSSRSELMQGKLLKSARSKRLMMKSSDMCQAAVEPKTGESFFLVMPYCNTDCMNLFLLDLSNEYKNDVIVLVCDGARWHNSNGLKIPDNIEILHIPPYTPEMNPIEQIWEEIREKGFRNECFQTLDKVVDRLCDTICALSFDTIMSITHRDWIDFIG